MIVKMKKATMLCLPSDKESALEKLRELGVMHIEHESRVESDDISKLEQTLNDIERALTIMATRDVQDSSKNKGDLSGREICEKAVKIIETDASLKKELDSLVRDRDRLAPWGNFSQELLEELKTKETNIYLCEGKKEDIDRLPEQVVVEEINEVDGVHYFLVVSHDPLDDKMLPLANIPEGVKLSELEAKITEHKSMIEKNEALLDDLVSYADTLKEYQTEVVEKLEFATNRDGMTDEGTVVHITGFVPKPSVDELTQTAKENGWGLLIVDPSPEDKVPTFIKVPKLFKISKPIFDFMGIAPGYNEVDVSNVFLIFFTIFFGMIIGDGGYGMIFLTCALIGKFKLKGNREAQLGLNLMMVLSLATIGWGLLTGNFFGVDPKNWPSFMQGIEWFKSNQHIQLLCFMIALAHLSIAHIWSAIVQINSPKAIGEIGWLMLIAGAFFIIIDMVVGISILEMMTAVKFLVAPGILLMLLFSVNWKDIGDILNFPFGAMSAFIDSLSYIRLFAVGLSGYYVAKSFNEMGMGLYDMESIIGYVGGTLIIIMGHMLNITLCIMGVLVHGIRLNTLEFSGHMNLEWAGFVFKPFKKLIEQK